MVGAEDANAPPLSLVVSADVESDGHEGAKGGSFDGSELFGDDGEPLYDDGVYVEDVDWQDVK